MNVTRTAEEVIEALDLELSVGLLGPDEPLMVDLRDLDVEEQSKVNEWLEENVDRIPSGDFEVCLSCMVIEGVAPRNIEEVMRTIFGDMYDKLFPEGMFDEGADEDQT